MTLGLSVIAIRMYLRPAKRLREEGNWQNGKWFDGIPTTTDIKAVFQGVKDTDLAQLPQGERASEYNAIWTEADVRTTEDGAGLPADILIDEFGTKWRLIQRSYRIEGGFSRCIGEKVDERGRSRDDD